VPARDSNRGPLVFGIDTLVRYSPNRSGGIGALLPVGQVADLCSACPNWKSTDASHRSLNIRDERPSRRFPAITLVLVQDIAFRCRVRRPYQRWIAPLAAVIPPATSPVVPRSRGRTPSWCCFTVLVLRRRPWRVVGVACSVGRLQQPDEAGFSGVVAEGKGAPSKVRLAVAIGCLPFVSRRHPPRRPRCILIERGWRLLAGWSASRQDSLSQLFVGPWLRSLVLSASVTNICLPSSSTKCWRAKRRRMFIITH